MSQHGGSVVLKRIDEKSNVFEEFLGLYHVTSIGAESVTAIVKDTNDTTQPVPCRGQCYDGCSTMCGTKTSVAKGITDEEPRAVYTHCYGHSISLDASDTIKQSELMKSAFDTTREI